MHRRDFLTALGGAALLPFVPATAEAATWVLLGTKRVNPIYDHDRYSVGSGAGLFRSIRFKVRGNNLYFYDLDVRFSNGGHQDVPVRVWIPQGGHTRTIDLDGGKRNIRYVDVEYGKSINGLGHTYVELWGKR
jgi:hypothetical protein